jgi:DNA-binding ferritin-like protein
MQKPNSSTGDVKAEIAEYIKMLQGQPLWAVEQAVDNVCKQYSFRDFSKLFQEIKSLIEPRVKKIERLQNIYKQSLKEIEEEKALKKAMDECPSMEDALKEAADNGNKFAKDFLRTYDFKAREQAVLEYKKCNELGDNFLKNNDIKKEK